MSTQDSFIALLTILTDKVKELDGKLAKEAHLRTMAEDSLIFYQEKAAKNADLHEVACAHNTAQQAQIDKLYEENVSLTATIKYSTIDDQQKEIGILREEIARFAKEAEHPQQVRTRGVRSPIKPKRPIGTRDTEPAPPYTDAEPNSYPYIPMSCREPNDISGMGAFEGMYDDLDESTMQAARKEHDTGCHECGDSRCTILSSPLSPEEQDAEDFRMWGDDGKSTDRPTSQATLDELGDAFYDE